MFTCARPSPGNCLAVAATPAELIPSTAARSARRDRAGVSSEHARSESGRAAPPGTSATGARLTLTPAPRSWRAASCAVRRTAAGSPCWGCPASGPAQATVRTSPPSWSTITSASPRPRAAPSGSGRATESRAGVEAEKDHPRRLARPQAPPHVAGSGRTGKLEIVSCPTCRRRLSRSTASSGAGPLRAAARRPACSGNLLAFVSGSHGRAGHQGQQRRDQSSPSRRRAAGSAERRMIGARLRRSRSRARHPFLLQPRPAAAVGECDEPERVHRAQRARAWSPPAAARSAPQASMRPVKV